MRVWLQVCLTGVLALAVNAQAAFAVETTDAVHQRALSAATQFQKRHPQAEVEWKAGQPGVAMVLGLDDAVAGATMQEKAVTFLSQSADLLGIPASDLRPTDHTQTKYRHVQRFQQTARIDGRVLPVYNREVTVTFDATNGHVLRLVSDAAPIVQQVVGALNQEQALQAAMTAVHGPQATRPAQPAASEAMVIVGQQARRVWIVHVPGHSLTDLRTFAVDAETGKLAALPRRVLD